MANLAGLFKDSWKATDTWLIKGLVFLGPKSRTWQRAPKSCQEAAQAMIDQGYEPLQAMSSDALSSPVSEDDIDMKNPPF